MIVIQTAAIILTNSDKEVMEIRIDKADSNALIFKIGNQEFWIERRDIGAFCEALNTLSDNAGI